MERGFFKFFYPKNGAKQLKIPTAFTGYKNGKLPKEVSLRDRFGNMWPIGVTKIESNFYFQDGWEKFIEDNTIESGDFLIFDTNGEGNFDFKLVGVNGCEKKGVGGLKLAVNEEEEEMNVELPKSVEPKGKNWDSDSTSESSDDDSNEDYTVEEEDEGDKEYEVVVEEEDDEKKEEKEELHDVDKQKEDENNEVNERAGTFKKKTPCPKAGCKRATTREVRDRHDQFGKDIFRSTGRATQPKNPYFVAKIRNKENKVHVPINVMKDYKFELPSSMTIRDSAGREFETKLKKWKDGRTSLVGGWLSLYNWNLVEKNDKCICEFVRGEHNEVLHLQVQVLHEGASSHPNKK